MNFCENIIHKAREASEKAWESSIRENAPENVGEALLAALKHPTLRYTLELYLNGSTTSLGARILKTTGLASFAKAKTRGTLSDRRVETVQLTYLGTKSAIEFMESYRDADWFQVFVGEITSYACRDDGEGICLNAMHLAAAREAHDFEILERVVNPGDGEYQFSLGNRRSYGESGRLGNEERWSFNYRGRKSAFVYDSRDEIGRPLWSFNDFDTFIELTSIEELSFRDC